MKELYGSDYTAEIDGGDGPFYNYDYGNGFSVNAAGETDSDSNEIFIIMYDTVE